MANMTYKGLTIRIGGDTAPLQRAIKEVNAAASEMHSQLRRVNAGLRFDPTNVDLLAAKMMQLGEKSVLAGAKAEILKRHMADLPKEVLERAEQDTGKLGARAALAAEEYNRLNEQIAEMRRKLAMEAYGLDSSATEKEIEEAVEAYKEFEAECRKAGDVANSELAELQARWQKVEQELEDAKGAVAVNDMKVELQKLEAETRQAAEEFVELKGKLMSLTGSDELLRARTNVRMLGDAADDTKADIHELDAALREGGNDAATAASKFLRLASRQDQLEEKAKSLRIQLRELKTTLGKPIDAKSLSRANVEFQQAKANFVGIRAEAEKARGRVVALQQEMNLIGKPSGNQEQVQLQRLQRELLQATAKARELEAEEKRLEQEYNAAHTVREISKVEIELQRTTAEARAASMAMKGMSAKNWYIIRSVGTVLMSTITPALSMGLQKIAEASETLDAAWRDMRKTVNGSEEDFQHLKDAAIEFSKTHVTTADQILEIEAMGGQLGIAVENLEAFSTTVANLDIATNMESDQISEDLGKLANILGMSVDEYDNFGDSLVRLGNNEAALEGDIMRITTRFAGMGKIVGMSGDQVLAWATAATATGQKAEAAGSSMQRFISNMETAVHGSEEDLNAWAKVAGMSGAEFQKSFGEDASGTMYKFIEGLANIQKSGGSVNQKLMELGITGVRDKQLLEGLAQQMVNATDDNNVLKDSLEMSSNAWNGISDKWGDAGDAMNEAEKKSQGFSGSLGKLKNTVTALASSAGNSLVPWMDKLTGIIGGLQEGYANLPEGSKQVINGIGGIVAAMGPMMMLVGAAGQGLTSFKKNLAENSAAALTEAQALSVLDAQEKINVATAMRDEIVTKKVALSKKTQTAATESQIAAYEGEIAILNSEIAAQERAIKKTKVAAGAMKAIKGIGIAAGITAAVEVTMLLVQSYTEARERAELLAKSQEKMNDIFDGFDASNEVKEADKARKSIKELKKAVDDAAQANIDMADAFNANMQETYDKSKNLDDIVGRIQRLSSQSDLTATQVNDLRTAVNQLNDATGKEWMVDDTGKIMDQQKTMSELTGSMEALVDAYNKVNGTELTIAEDGWVSEANITMQDLLDAVNELNGTDFVVDAEGNIESASGKFNDMAVEIRDVVSATDELREAQNRLWLQEAYQKSAQEADENKRKSRTELEEAEEELARLDTLAAQYKQNLGENSTEYQNAAAEAAGYRAEVARLRAEYEEDAKAADLWRSNQEGLDAAIANTDSIEAALTRFDELGEVLVPKGMGIEDLADSMKVLGLTFDDVANLSAEDVEKIVDDWDGHMPSLIKRLQEAGVEIDDTTVKIADLAEQSGLSAPQISEMWDQFGGDVDMVQAAIEVLNETNIDPKDVEIKDNTFIVKKHISDVDKQKIEDKGFKVDDSGTLESTLGELGQVMAKLNVLDGDSATIKLAVEGKSVLDSALAVMDKILKKNGKTATIYTKTGRSATGATVVRNARGRVFDGVISSPTLTNIGLVGEAGAEWVDSANGRVIPLTNRKYMVPIAREIAAGLNSYGGGRSVNVSVALNYRAGDDANQMAADLTRALRRKILMEG